MKFRNENLLIFVVLNLISHIKDMTIPLFTQGHAELQRTDGVGKIRPNIMPMISPSTTVHTRADHSGRAI
jgi:hypothetical protein